MIKKLLATFSLIFTMSVIAQGATVSLAWDPSCNTNLISSTVYFTTNKLTTPLTNMFPAYVDDCGTNRPASTNIYWGNYSPTNIVTAPGWNASSATVSNLVRGAKYYFIVTCRTQTLESDRSNEVEYTVPFYGTNTVPSKVTGVRIMLISP